ncbi:hypothetical protein JXA80_03405, partial [bacterium]|nr:hypothetical protein [candidate division CSSED10-310 bacterium]
MAPGLAGRPDSQRESLQNRVPGSGDAIAVDLLENDPEVTVQFGWRLESDSPAGLPTRGLLLRISDTQVPEVILEPIRVRRVVVDSLESVNDALRAAGKEPMPSGIQSCVPESMIDVGKPMIMRSIRVLPIRINAVQFDPVARELIICEEARVVVRMRGDDTINVLRNPPPVTRTFDRYYRSTVMNYEFDRDSLDQNPETYLVFTPDEYESRLQGWIAW